MDMLSPGKDGGWHGLVSRRARVSTTSLSPTTPSTKLCWWRLQTLRKLTRSTATPTRSPVPSVFDGLIGSCSSDDDIFDDDSEEDNEAASPPIRVWRPQLDQAIGTPIGTPISQPWLIPASPDEVEDPLVRFLVPLGVHSVPTPPAAPSVAPAAPYEPSVVAVVAPAGAGKRALLEKLEERLRSELAGTAIVQLLAADTSIEASCCQMVNQSSGKVKHAQMNEALFKAWLHRRAQPLWKRPANTGPPEYYRPPGPTYLLVDVPHSTQVSQVWLPCPLPQGMYVVFACDTEAQVAVLSEMWTPELSSNWHVVQLPELESVEAALSKVAGPCTSLAEHCAPSQLQRTLDAMQLGQRCENTPLCVDALDGWVKAEKGEVPLHACLQLKDTTITYPALVEAMLVALERSVGVKGAAHAVHAVLSGKRPQHPWLAPLLPLHWTARTLLQSRYPPTVAVPISVDMPELWKELAEAAMSQQNAAAEVLCWRATVECLRRTEQVDTCALGRALWRLSVATRRSGKSAACEAQEAVQLLASEGTVEEAHALHELALVWLGLGALKESISCAQATCKLLEQALLEWTPLNAQALFTLAVGLARAAELTEEIPGSVKAVAVIDTNRKARAMLLQCKGNNAPATVEVRWRCNEPISNTAHTERQALLVSLMRCSISDCTDGAAVPLHCARMPVVRPGLGLYKKVLLADLTVLMAMEKAPAGVDFGVEAALVLTGHSSKWVDFKQLSPDQLLQMLRQAESNLASISTRQVATCRALLKGISPELLISKSAAAAALCGWATSVAMRWEDFSSEAAPAELIEDCWLCIDIGNQYTAAAAGTASATAVRDPRFELVHQLDCFIRVHRPDGSLRAECNVENVSFELAGWASSAELCDRMWTVQVASKGDCGSLRAHVKLKGQEHRLVLKHALVLSGHGGFTRYIMSEGAALKENHDARILERRVQAVCLSCQTPVNSFSGQPWRERHPGALFGVPLSVAAQRSDPAGLLPAPVLMCCNWLRQRGLGEEGLFRIPGSRKTVRGLIAAIDSEPNFELSPKETVPNVCSLLVQFLQQLTQADAPLWGVSKEAAAEFEKEVVSVVRQHRTQLPKIVEAIRNLVQQLPAENQATLKAICSVLHAANQPKWTKTSKMDASKFAVCLMPQIQAGLANMVEKFEDVFGEEWKPE